MEIIEKVKKKTARRTVAFFLAVLMVFTSTNFGSIMTVSADGDNSEETTTVEDVATGTTENIIVKSFYVDDSCVQAYDGTPKAPTTEKGKEFSWNGNGVASLKFFTKKGNEYSLTFSEDDDETNDGAAPVEKGQYYVQVTISADETYKETKSRYFSFVITDKSELWTSYISSKKLLEHCFAGGSGTEDDPYQISTPQELANFQSVCRYGISNVNSQTGETTTIEPREFNGKHYILTADINMNYKDWSPIYCNTITTQSTHDSFTGSFDGQGHTIYGLGAAVYVGQGNGTIYGFALFEKLAETAVISNLTISKPQFVPDMTGTEYNSAPIGAVAIKSIGATIENCHVKGGNFTCVTGEESQYKGKAMGGIVAIAYGGTTFTNCSSSVAIDTTGNNGADGIGGIVGSIIYGYSFSTRDTVVVSNCQYKGDITVTNENNMTSVAGGIVGYVEGGEPVSIEKCANEGTIQSSLYGGGIVGRSGATSNYSLTILNSYNTGKISASNSNTSSNAGGIVGYSSSGTTVDSCFNVGQVIGYYAQPLASLGTSIPSITNCYGLQDCSTSTVSNNTTYGIIATQDQFENGEIAYKLNGKNTSEGEAIWGQKIGTDTQPGFMVEDGSTVYRGLLPCGHEGNIYSNTKYSDSIAKPIYKNGLCTECGKYEPAVKAGDSYQITNAGNLAWFASLVNEGTWDGVEKDKYANAVVTEDIDMSDVCYPASKGKEAKNWTPIGGYNSTNYRYYGTFDGENHTISNLYFYSTDSTNSEVGGGNYAGLFGYMSIGSTVKNVHLENVDITGNNHVGGIAGKNFTTNASTVPGTIENCSVSGSVKGTATSSTMVGGIVGEAMSVVKNCYSTANVSAPTYVGGIAGRGYLPGSITNCYSLGTVTGTSNAGGIMGYRQASTVYTKNSYYLSGSVSVNNVLTDKGIGNVSTVDSNNEAYAKDADSFASGEITYLLNCSISTPNEGEVLVWYQNINNGSADKSPVQDDKHGIVFKKSDNSYSNYEKEKNTITWVEGSLNASQTYDGNSKSLSCEKDNDFTWLGNGTASIDFYYTKEDGGDYTKTTTDCGAESEGKAPKNVGTYYAHVIVTGDADYSETSAYMEFTITNIASPTNYITGTKGLDNWYVTDVTISASGWEVSTDGSTWNDSLSYTKDGAYTVSSLFFKQKGTGYITEEITATTFKIDKTAPSQTSGKGINVSGHTWWKSLLEKISFDCYKDKDVTISAVDNQNGSGIAKYYYYVDTTNTSTTLTANELKEKKFTECDGLFSIDIDGSYIIYAYIKDKAGNKSDYFCSDGVVIDTIKPIISMTVPEETKNDVTATLHITTTEIGTLTYLISESNTTYTSLDGVNGIKTDLITVDQVTNGKKIILSSLKPSTTYYVYAMITDAASNTSDIVKTDFTTNETPTEVITTEASTEVTTTEVITTEAPTEVVTTEATTEVITTEAPTEVATTEAPTEVATTETPTEVVTTEATTEVITTEKPMKVTTTQKPTTKKPTTTTKPNITVNKMSVKKITAKKKSLKITWKKVSGVTGYEIQYSLKSNFKSAKIKKIKKAKATSYSLKKLKVKKKYYVRIRAYRVVAGKIYKSKWSGKKSKKTK